MNFPTLSAHAEEFLALKRAVAKVDPHRNTQDRRSLKHSAAEPQPKHFGKRSVVSAQLQL